VESLLLLRLLFLLLFFVVVVDDDDNDDDVYTKEKLYKTVMLLDTGVPGMSTAHRASDRPKDRRRSAAEN